MIPHLRPTLTLAAFLLFTHPGHDAHAQAMGGDATPTLPARLTLPTVTVDHLSNGLTVLYTRTSDLPIVELSLLVKAGTKHEPLHREGIANLARVTLLNSVPGNPIERMSAELTAQGSSLSSSTTYDYTAFTIKALARNFRQSADVLSNLITRPAIVGEGVNTARTAIQQSLVRLRESQAARASRAFLAAMFGADHYLARNAFGSVTTLDSVTTDDITAFVTSFYRPETATLLLAGGVDYAGIKSLIEDRFGSWKPADAVLTAPPDAPVAARQAAVIINDTAAAFVQLRMAFPTGSRASLSLATAMLANQVLGGSSESLLSRALWKDHVVAPNFYSSLSVFQDNGYSVIAGSVPITLLDSTLTLIHSSLLRIQDGNIDNEMLETARRQLLGNNINEFSSTSRMLGKLRDIVAYGLPLEHFQTLYTDVLATSKSAVSSWAAKYLDPLKATISAYGNAETITPILHRHFGQTLDITVK